MATQFEKEQAICTFKNPYTQNEPIVFQTNSDAQNFTLKLYNISGQEVYQNTFISSETTYINKGLKGDLYLMKISDNRKILIKKKIVIQ